MSRTESHPERQDGERPQPDERQTATAIDADERAAAFIREQGGRLFVWASDAGIEHETNKPRAGVDFVEIQADGFALYVDPSIEMPHRWKLVYHRFPTPHVRALWNGGVWSVPGSPYGPYWEGDRPSDGD